MSLDNLSEYKKDYTIFNFSNGKIVKILFERIGRIVRATFTWEPNCYVGVDAISSTKIPNEYIPTASSVLFIGNNQNIDGFIYLTSNGDLRITNSSVPGSCVEKNVVYIALY